jgi:aryl-alcohol dehydrogenase-like predicted oxidoreductase
MFAINHRNRRLSTAIIDAFAHHQINHTVNASHANTIAMMIRDGSIGIVHVPSQRP